MGIDGLDAGKANPAKQPRGLLDPQGLALELQYS
jgi:hypothetical protein